MNLSNYWGLSAGILAFLTSATLVSRALTWKIGTDNPVIHNLNERIKAWWWLVGVGVPVLAGGAAGATVLFAVLSFLTLREFISLTPTRPGDQPALFSAFFIAVPVQYLLVGSGWYGLFSILIPVYGFFLFAAVSTLAQDTTHFLERNAKIQWAVMVCVYGLSHAPALLTLDIPGYNAKDGTLLLYFLFVVQISDVLQYVCGKLWGKRKIAPVLSPNKTVEGLAGGGALACLVGAALYGFTPFDPLQAALRSFAIVMSGFFGGLVLSAVKRSLNAKDWGASIPGHGGMLDRLDSVAFSAPIFFHLTRYWSTP
jgi:phosphatidate cytidylyltransferase